MLKQGAVIFIQKQNEILENVFKTLLGDMDLKIVYLSEQKRKQEDSQDGSHLNRYYELNIEDTDALQKFINEEYQGEEIYYLGMISKIVSGPLDLQSIRDYQEIGIKTCWRLIKALHPKYKQEQITLNVITNQMFKVLEHDQENPGFGAVKGFMKTVMKEYHSWKVRAFDIVFSEDKEELFQNLQAGFAYDGDWIAVRNGICYKQEFHAAYMEEKKHQAWRQNGTYFILGGSGGIGFALAEYLTKKYHANIILAGRRAINDEIKSKIQVLEKNGGKAIYVTGDCTSQTDMKECLACASEAFGALNGVIHSAIVLKDTRIVNMEEDVLDKVMAPKVEGVYCFYEAFKDEPLDFMLFFSSMQAFVGSFGQANYAGASSFEDSYVEYLNRIAAFPVKLINWGFWGKTGIVSNDIYNQSLLAQGVIPMKTEEGLEIMEKVLENDFRQIAAIHLTDETKNIVHMYDEKCYRKLKEEPSFIEKIAYVAEKSVTDTDAFQAFREGLEKLDEYSVDLLGRILADMGFSDIYKTKETWMNDLHIERKYERLFTVLLHLLQREKMVSQQEDRYKLNPYKVPSSEMLKQEKVDIFNVYSEVRAHLELIDTCIRNYPEILTGKVSYVDIMFPAGKKSLVEKIYKGNKSADYYNELVAEIVYETVKQKQGRKEPVRILEVGSGTGGTSSFVLKKLAQVKESIIYYYTDISLSFVQYGMDNYKELYPFVEFKLLDIEKDIVSQGYETGSMDLVFGSNVFHATKDMTNTLQNVKQLLKSKGLIVINEMTYAEIFTSLAFGLTDGWWLYDDEKIRIPGSPLLSVRTWRDTLDVLGYENTRVFSFKNLKEEEYEQSVVLSESDGIVCESGKVQEAYLHTLEETPKEEKVIQNVSIETKTNIPVKINTDLTKELIMEFVKDVFVEVLHVKRSLLKKDVTFEKIGVDSLIILEINKQFMKKLGKVPATLLFEYNTIGLLADYFLQEKKEELSQLLLTRSNTAVVKEESGNNVLTFSWDSVKMEHGNEKVIEEIRKETKAEETEDIAIIGLAGRYPESDTLEQFWTHLKNGDNLIGDIPKGRWNIKKYYQPGEVCEGKMYTTKGGFLGDVDKFDALFFSITPKEAQMIDPQERLSLENVWSLLEDAALTREHLTRQKNRVGVFWGVMNNDYVQCGGKTSYWSIVNRISYIMNFTGPSIAVDTACSSSLTAIHLACQSIRQGECTMAVAGGVNLILSPEHYVNLCSMGMLSKSGRCSAFGKDADGFVDGEGVGSILLKPLSKAVKDKNHIYGVIKSSAMNAGGKTSGYTVPNPNEQAAMIQAALNIGKIVPESISYVETHGTGTALGDPIEIRGLQKAFGIKNEKGKFCSVGSVKSNIGHLESASGIASITKVLLQMKYKMLAPSIHSDELNPQIDFDVTPFYVQHKLETWEESEFVDQKSGKAYKRRACISSFGAGGANAHVIVEEYNQSVKKCANNSKHIFVLSADGKEQLREYATSMKQYLESHIQEINAEDLEFTLVSGRELRKEKVEFEFESVSDVITILDDYLEGKEISDNRIVFADNFIEEHKNLMGKAISLPTYPFKKDRCWVENSKLEKLFENLAEGKISAKEMDYLMTEYFE